MLIHLVADEFLELELTSASERLRLAHALGLSRMDLTGCKVHVTFNAEPLTDEKLHANLQRNGARARDHSRRDDRGQIDWLSPPKEADRCDESCADPDRQGGPGES